MEEWAKFIEKYDLNTDNNKIRAALRGAKVALDEDLAPFESDWIFSTLLHKPVHLLTVVAEKRLENYYTKCTEDALKLLSDAIIKYDNIKKYYEDIVQLCLLSYPAIQRQYALACLTHVARRAVCGATDYHRHLAALQQGVCMTPLAVLIGTICECHPNVVAEDVTNIWRVFLNMLDSKKYSGAVTKAVLQGILGLFKNFGDELPSAELIRFYPKIVEHLEGNCQGVCLEILTHHARLFSTCITRDAGTRALLWTLGATDAITAVYDVCDKDVLQEVLPYTESPDYRKKFTALRVLGGEAPGLELQELEYQLRNGNVDYELCEGISWCIQTNPASSHRLLQATILLYDTIPKNKRTDIIKALLNSHTDVINVLVTFIISEVIKDQKLTIWEDILKSNSEKLCIVYDNINKYINTVVEGVMEEMEGPPLVSLFPLLLSLPPIPLRIYRLPKSTCDTTALLGVFSGRLQNISISRCMDEVKLKCSLVVLELMDEHSYPNTEILTALRTIFSYNNIEAAILSKAVNALGVIERNHCIDDYVLTEIINNLERIRRQTDKSKKADRILYRDLFVFLGKHEKPDTNNDELNYLISELKSTLTLQIPYEGGTIKMNLNRMLYDALVLEDGEALDLLLMMICDKLSSTASPNLGRVLVRVCVCLSHHKSSSRVVSALAMADGCSDELIQHILKEESSESRKILIEGLVMMIQRQTDNVLEGVVEGIVYIEEKNNQAYFQLLDKIIDLLKDKNSICQKFLPDLLIKVLKTENTEVIIEKIYCMFVDKIFLYNDRILHTMIDVLLNIDGNCMNRTMDFIKIVLNKTNGNINDYIHGVEGLTVFISLKGCMDFDETMRSKVVKRGKRLFQECGTDLESVLEFLSVFSDVLLDEEYEETVTFLSNIIHNITTQQLLENRKHFVSCVKSVKKHVNVIPAEILIKLENYVKRYNIKHISESVEKNGINKDDELMIRSIKVIIETCDGLILSNSEDFVVLWKDMFNKLYESGYMKYLEANFDVLSDLTFVALKYMREEDVLSILLRGPDDFGVKFAAALISVFYPYLTKTILMECSILLYDVVRYANRSGRMGEVNELIDQIWPFYEKITTYRQKQQLLLECLPGVSGDSGIYRGLVTIMNSDVDIESKLMILDVLPKGDVYGSLPLPLFPLLPSRLSELRGSLANSFRAILDALATNRHTDVLNAVATLAANDPTEGWWDWALDSCMRSLAKEDELGLLQLVYTTCTEHGYSAFLRLMMPLLRHSKASTIESFVSPLLPGLLTSLRLHPREASPRVLSQCLMEHVRTFNILEIIFQKVPKERIESPRSRLYSALSVDTLYYLVSAVCKLCVTLRNQFYSAGVEKEYRLFQHANYSCLASALLCREPRLSIYSCVFDVKVWSELVSDEEASVPLMPQWVQRVTRHATSIPSIPSVPSVASRFRTSTLRSRMFLRTLSENPLMYDLVETEDEELTMNVYLPDNPLNRHPCMPHIMGLLSKVGAETEGVDGWRGAVIEALGRERPIGRMIAQAVCNARECLTPHAGSLIPGLLSLITDGQTDQLHVDILDTVIYWKASINEIDNLNKAIECLVATIIDRQTDSVYWTLMDKLTNLLDIYKDVTISWLCFEEHFKDPSSTKFKTCLTILSRVNIYIPELLPALSRHLARRMILLLTVYGRTMRLMKERGEDVEEEVVRFRGLLDRTHRSDVAVFIKALYYVQKQFPQICDYQQFRSICDLIPKIPHRERPHCLSILSKYIENGGRGDLSVLETIELDEMIDTVQGLELAICALHVLSPPLRQRVLDAAGSRGHGGQVYQLMMRDFELHRTTYEPSIKRRADLLFPPTATMVGLSRGVAGGEGELRGLSQDMGVRLYECLMLCLVVPLTHHLTIRLSAVLELFLQDIKGHDVFKNCKLSANDIFIPPSTSHTLTDRAANKLNKDSNAELNIQTSMEDALKIILQFARKDDSFCTSLIIQLIHQFGSIRPGFDFHSTISNDISSCIKISPVAPSVMEIARQIDLWQDIKLDTLTDLIKCTKSSEGEDLSRLLYEEGVLRKGKELFVLGKTKLYDDEMTAGNEIFSIEDLMSTFGKLSNWDNLTIQQKHAYTKIPALWTDRQTFKLCVDNHDFTEAPLWARCLVSKYKNEDVHTYTILRDLDKWPKKQFDVAAVLESQLWDVTCDTHTYTRSDCLAKWAFRIMMRSLYSESYLPSRSHAMWSMRGNEMEIYEQVILCCKSIGTNEDNLLANLKCHEMLARRGIALKRNDKDGLRNLLDEADDFVKLEKDHSFGDILGMNVLTLRLRRDLNSLEKVHTDNIIHYMKKNLKNLNNDDVINVDRMCILGITYLDTLCEESTDISQQSDLLLSVCDLIALQSTPSFDVLLHRLDSLTGKLEEDVSQTILNMLQPLMKTFDDYSIQQLSSNSHLFHSHPVLEELHQNQRSLDRYRQCLSLIADPVYLLRQYVGMLLAALETNDVIKYEEIFINMKRRIFDSPYIGPDYIVLNKYTSRLDSLIEFGTDTHTTKHILKGMLSELHSRKECLSVCDVCPALVTETNNETLNKLLGLKAGVNFVKFVDKVSVYSDAVSRPVLLSFISSDGRTRRCIVKSEGPAHGAAVRLRGALERAWGLGGGYKVTPLTSECLLIEYLENNTRLRDMVGSICAVDVPLVSRTADADLILSPFEALTQFEAAAKIVPATALRSAIEAKCVTLQEFINKKKKFTDSVCYMTLFSFICGLSDRHLQNILYDPVSGTVCNVDCGDLRFNEIPPARLTRNILAVCHNDVIESRLQKLLSRLREYQGIILPSINIAFKNTEYIDKLVFIRGKIQGRLLQHQVTRDCIRRSDMKYKDRYVQLMDDIFGTEEKSLYSVEEQVSSLLLQCTDPRILSITRSGWEPWI